MGPLLESGQKRTDPSEFSDIFSTLQSTSVKVLPITEHDVVVKKVTVLIFSLFLSMKCTSEALCTGTGNQYCGPGSAWIHNSYGIRIRHLNLMDPDRTCDVLTFIVETL